MIKVVQMYQLDLIKVLFFQGSEGVQGSQNCLYFNFPQFQSKGGGAAPLNDIRIQVLITDTFDESEYQTRLIKENLESIVPFYNHSYLGETLHLLV